MNVSLCEKREARERERERERENERGDKINTPTQTSEDPMVVILNQVTI
jgi:hypothetical protein